MDRTAGVSGELTVRCENNHLARASRVQSCHHGYAIHRQIEGKVVLVEMVIQGNEDLVTFLSVFFD
jgi:hypothetical protein